MIRDPNPCADAVVYLLSRAQTDPDLGYLLGPGTESFERLCRAEAALLGEDVAAVRARRSRDLQPEHRWREPDVVVLRRERDAYRDELREVGPLGAAGRVAQALESTAATKRANALARRKA